MKKVISLVLAFVMAMAITTTVFAEGDNTQEYHMWGESTVTGRVYSSCVITIPETIDFGETSEWSIGITQADIEAGYAVNIYIVNLNENGAITLEQDNGDFTADLYLGRNGQNTYVSNENNLLATFRDTDISAISRSTAPILCCGRIVTPSLVGTQGVSAGTYTGVMQYEVRIEEYGN